VLGTPGRTFCQLFRGAAISSSYQTRLNSSDAAIDERAAQFFQSAPDQAASVMALSDLIRAMDLTSLEGTEDEAAARALCERALLPAPERPSLPSVAAVCVYPALIAECKRALSGSRVRVASVAAFPSGRAALSAKLGEARAAVDLGADEIDLVIDYQGILAGQEQRAAEEIARVKQAIGSTRLKVILETGQLRDQANVRRASELALGAGADFLKTSTGKTQPGATPGATLIMLDAIAAHHASTGRKVGIKPAGGIRTARQALGYARMVEATLGKDWLVPELFRLGASALLGDVVFELLAHRE
jgi:deoxyribose-phosphate aldolase